MNKKPLAGLALVILLAVPLSALAEATAGEAVWTPPVVTAEEMEAARLGERIVMRGQEGDDVRLVQQRLYDLGYLSGSVDGKFGLQTQKAVRVPAGAQAGKDRRQGRPADDRGALWRGRDRAAHADPGSDAHARGHADPDRHAGRGARAPFAMREMDFIIDGQSARLMVGLTDADEPLYPLCGVMERAGV